MEASGSLVPPAEGAASLPFAAVPPAALWCRLRFLKPAALVPTPKPSEALGGLQGQVQVLRCVDLCPASILSPSP